MTAEEGCMLCTFREFKALKLIIQRTELYLNEHSSHDEMFPLHKH